MENRTVRYVLDRYAAAWEDDYPFKERALQAWRTLNGILPASWKFYGQLHDPQAYVSVQDSVEHLMATIFSRENFFDVEADGGQSMWLRQRFGSAGPVVAVELYREHLQQNLRRMRYKVRKFIQALETVSFGNGVVRHHAVRVPAPEGGWQLWADEANVSRFNFTVAGGALFMPDCPYAIERIPNVPLADAIALAGNNPDVVKELQRVATQGVQRSTGGSGGRSEADFDLYERLSQAGYSSAGGKVWRSESGVGSTDNLPKTVELLLYAERGDLGDWNRIIIIANREVLVCDKPNPYHNGRPLWSDARFAFINSELWQGRGLVDIERDEIDITNIRLNQLHEFLERLRRPNTWVGEAANVKESDFWMFEAAPGRVTPMGDVNAARRMEERSDVVNYLVQMMTQHRANNQRLSGQTDVGRGMLGSSSGLSQGTQTATGLSLLMQRQSQTMAFKLLLMEQTGFLDALENTASIAQQTLREPRRLDVSRNETLSQHGIRGTILLEPEDIQGRFRLVATGSAQSQDDPQQAQLLIEWLKLGAGLPGVGERLKLLDAFKVVGEKMRVPTPSQFIMTDEEMMAKQASAGNGGIPPALLNAGKAGLAEGVRNGARKVAEAGVPELAMQMAGGAS